MALIKCPECGKEVSDKANACPNCGYPINESTDSDDGKLLSEIIVNDSLTLYFDLQTLVIKQGGEIRVSDALSSFSIMDVQKDCKPSILISHNQMLAPIVIIFNENNRGKLVQLKQNFNTCKPVTAHKSTPKITVSKKQLQCPKCKSINLQYLGGDNIGGREAKIKTSTSLNLNPLKPFTLFNQKEKVVKKAREGIDLDRWRCQDCGKVFTTIK